VTEGVRGGKSLHHALLPFERDLGRRYLVLVRAGEASGALSLVLKELTAHGKQHGVAVCIENLQRYWNRPDYLRPVLKAFTPDEVNLCLDPINLYWYGFPRSQVYEFVTEYIPRVRHFHVKNVAHPEDKREVQREPGWEYGKNSVPAAEGDLDFKRILTELHKAGYRGYVSIEDDSLGHYPKDKRVDILRQDVAYLRGIIAGL
ncbi:MAG TPA: TIM barrel protein, partial [Candidatus Latescibacteria bacterium]|nr:TIM barrel protein [Candidatus Latescibacterota bacterium]